MLGRRSRRGTRDSQRPQGVANAGQERAALPSRHVLLLRNQELSHVELPASKYLHLLFAREIGSEDLFRSVEHGRRIAERSLSHLVLHPAEGEQAACPSGRVIWTGSARMTLESRSWESLLCAPCPGDHLVQLCRDDDSLVRGLTWFAGEGLANGEALLVISTADHARALIERMRANPDVESARERGQFVLLDARDCVEQLLNGSMPVGDRLLALVDSAGGGFERCGFSKLRVFGEMVDLLLLDGAPEAADALEEMWDRALASRTFSLLCSYRVNLFDRRIHRGLLQRIGRRHSHLVPVEDYARLETAVVRAYEETFGLRGDAQSLRERAVSRVPQPPVAPAAYRALVALRDVHADLADEVLDRARAGYAALTSGLTH